MLGSRAHTTYAIVAVMALVGCEYCRDPEATYVVTDAQIATLTDGTGIPTTGGCQTVCQDLVNQIDAATADAGAVPDFGAASGRTETGYLHCALSARQLTCIWPRTCAR